MLSPNAVLTVDLTALAWNYRRLMQQAGAVPVAPAVKANAYGMGVEKVLPVLWQEGARSFFVAQAGEGLAVRAQLPEARVYILNGIQPGEERDFIAQGLVPMANSPQQLAIWADAATYSGKRLPVALQIDTGMSRLGFAPEEVDWLYEQAALFQNLEVLLVASHLASADDAASPQTEEQLARFVALCGRLPEPARSAPRSLDNSPGLFRDPVMRFDLVRPGYALYGGNPTPERENPMRPVARLAARVLQTREIAAGTPVGYGATWRAPRRSRLATLGIGYADGFSRALSNSGKVVIAGRSVLVVGRVSMDLTTVDITDLPSDAVGPGDLVTILGDGQDADALGEATGTIGYEVLATMGPRLHRVYVGD